MAAKGLLNPVTLLMLCGSQHAKDAGQHLAQRRG